MSKLLNLPLLERKNIKVLSVGKSFILGKCQCGYCDEDIPITPGRYGDLRRFKLGHAAKGINNPRYKGWKLNYDKRKMLYMPWHPNSDTSGYIYEHIFNMTRKLKRPLKKGEVVHHIDEDITNNDINNLQLFNSQGEHISGHFKIDMSDRRCSDPNCKNPTDSSNGKYQGWYNGENGLLCKNCYRRKKYNEKKK